ncbi:MAG TPA: MFS transporter [Candidatus Paceibacterota bacterium]|nr:MFS transporter [Candidatus Paceibacterota bacterium]
MRTFYHVLGNNLIASITNYTVWFALTFYAFLQTQSVFVTGMIAGIYLVLTAASGFWFGGIVDHHHKKQVMLGSSTVSFAFYTAAFLLYQTAEPGTFAAVGNPALWAFILILMVGVLVGNIRTISLATLVTILVPEDRRDKANGLVGMVTGIGFLTTSVISGFLVAWGGMFYALLMAIILTAAVFLHLSFIRIEEKHLLSPDGSPAEPKRLDIPGTIRIIRSIPGLIALIFFTTFNNFLGGIFMALMDAYGLSLVSVQTWGLLFGFLSTAFILSGIIIAKTGLGKNPLKTLMVVNIIAWSTCCIFTIQPSIALLAAGCFIWFLIGPYAEAAEHTTLQKVVPLERQGRVFGFAQSVEQAASPLTAFLIGPLAQFFFMPFMTTGLGAKLIGDWFGTGPARGIALVFTVAGLVGLVVTILAFNSKYYRRLSAYYLSTHANDAAPQAAS